MRVLIVDDEPVVAKQIAALLQKAGHEPEIASDGSVAMARVKTEHFDVLMCDWMLPDVDGTSVIRHIRSRAQHQPAVVLMSGAVAPTIRAHAARVGADAFLAKPIVPQAVLSALASAVDKRAKASPTAPHPIALTSAWIELDTCIATTLSDCVGVLFRACELEPGEIDHKAALFMLDVGRKTDLGIALFVPRSSGVMLAKQMLGEEKPDDTTVKELLRELCNNIAGVLKTAARADGYAFTLGLPSAEVADPDAFESALAVAKRCGFSSESIVVEAIAGVRVAPSVAIPTNKLTEQMVLAEDIYNEAGTLVAGAGTRLTASTAERIARHLPKRTVRVCMLDASRAA